MNSADVHKSTKSDLGTKVGEPYIVPSFKSLTLRKGKELLLRRGNFDDPELRHMLDSSNELQGRAAHAISVPRPPGSHDG